MDTESDKFRNEETLKCKTGPTTQGNEKKGGTLWRGKVC